MMPPLFSWEEIVHPLAEEHCTTEELGQMRRLYQQYRETTLLELRKDRMHCLVQLLHAIHARIMANCLMEKICLRVEKEFLQAQLRQKSGSSMRKSWPPHRSTTSEDDSIF